VHESDSALFEADVGTVVEVVAYVEPVPDESVQSDRRWKNICEERGYTEPSSSTISHEDVQDLRRDVRVGDLVRLTAFQEGFATRSNRAGFAYDGSRKRLRVGHLADFVIGKMQDWPMPEVEAAIRRHSDGKQFTKERKPRPKREKDQGGVKNGNAHGKKGQLYERADVFAGWLIDTFGASAGTAEGSGVATSLGAGAGASSASEKSRGVQLLNVGCGVLDVAGGRGDLSSALTCSGVSSTVLDPRPKSGSLTKKTRRKMAASQAKNASNRVEICPPTKVGVPALVASMEAHALGAPPGQVGQVEQLGQVGQLEQVGSVGLVGSVGSGEQTLGQAEERTPATQAPPPPPMQQQHGDQQQGGESSVVGDTIRPSGKFSTLHVFFGTHLLTNAAPGSEAVGAAADGETTTSAATDPTAATTAAVDGSTATAAAADGTTATAAAADGTTAAPADGNMHMESGLQIPQTCKPSEVTTTSPEVLLEVRRLIGDCR
jgi:hypothetical protein